MQTHIEFCVSGEGTRIAYQTYGDPALPPLLGVTTWWASLEHEPENTQRFWREMSAVRFGILFDRRGTGASQRDVQAVQLDAQCRDILALMDHLGIERTDVIAQADGLPAALAAQKPWIRSCPLSS